MNAHPKSLERNVETRFTARRVAHWSVLLVALGQSACEDDPEPWAIVDASVDGAAPSDAAVETPKPDAASDDTTGTPTDDVTVSIGTGEGPDASPLDAAPANTEVSIDAGSTQVVGTSAPTSGSVAESSAPTAGSTSVTPPPEAGVTSDVDAGATGTGASTATDTGEESTGPLLVCSAVIDPELGISLAEALENYTSPTPVDAADGGLGDGGFGNSGLGDGGFGNSGLGDGGVVGDAGARAECYPPCISALLQACPVTASSCVNDTTYEACWDNGVSQVQVFEFGADTLTVSESVYKGSAPCISGVVTTDFYDFVSTYVWYDGTGAQVATGTEDAYGYLEVTCDNDAQTYPVDKSACPELGQVLYTQLDCGAPAAL